MLSLFLFYFVFPRETIRQLTKIISSQSDYSEYEISQHPKIAFSPSETLLSIIYREAETGGQVA